MDNPFMREEINVGNKCKKRFSLNSNSGNADQDYNEKIFYIHSFGKIKKFDNRKYWRDCITTKRLIQLQVGALN